MTRGRAAAAVVGALLVLVGPLASAGHSRGSAAGGGREPVTRLLVLSLPTLSWADLELAPLPNLNRLIDQSAVAALSVRGVDRRTGPGEGYGMLGAGTRVVGSTLDGLALETDEPFEGGTARQVFARRTGIDVLDGVVSLAHPALRSANEGLNYGAEVSALGQALAEGGVPRGVIANADIIADDGLVEVHREAVTALSDPSGVLPEGRVSRELLTEDPSAPFGQHLDHDITEEAFADLWSAGGVVLVEASDLARFDRYAARMTPEQRAEMRLRLLVDADELAGRLLERVDTGRDAVLVVAPYHARSEVHLTVAALRAPGLEPGLLRSATTRRSGFVQLVDVAPTILDVLGVQRPASMEGRPFERGDTGGPASARRDMLVDANEAAQFRDRMVAPVATWFILLNLVLWLAAGFALTRSRRRLGRAVRVAALGVLGFLPATYLAGLVPFFRIGDAWYWVFALGVGGAIGATAALLGRRAYDPLLLALGAVVGLLLVDVVVGAPLQINTVFGYSPTVAGRFAGYGNLAFAQLAAGSLLIGVLLAKRIGGRRGAWAGVGVFAVAVIADGAPMWGSDVGGVLALVPGMGAAAVMLLGWRLRWRTVLVGAAATAVAIAAFAALDFSRAPDARTHLGRLVEDIADDGFGVFETVVVRKLEANLSVLLGSVWTRMVPVVLAFIVFLLWQAPGRLRQVQRAVPEALVGLLVVGLLGFALNDSGIAVPGLMLGVINASLVFLVMRTLGPEDPEAADSGRMAAETVQPETVTPEGLPAQGRVKA